MFIVTDAIAQVESKWYSALFNHLQVLYKDVHLPSHDVDHHIRVWKLCKDLVVELCAAGVPFSTEMLEQLIVASMFHDTGLIAHKGEDHGYHSRLICEDFFSNNPELTVNNIPLVCNAIEHHDDKTVKEFSFRDLNDYSDITRIVSAADDLDAFGYIGIFRYIEIYLLRGVPMAELPARVMQNICNRFANFENGFPIIKAFVDIHRKKYQVAYNFFQSLHTEITNSAFSQNHYLSITNTLSSCLIKEKMDIYKTIIFALREKKDDNHCAFFENLKKELVEAKNASSLHHTTK